MRSGPFNGFVVKEKQNPDGSPRLANVGSFQLTSKADGKISAKIVTSKGTYQFSAASWDSAGDKFALKAATTNKDILEIEVDPAAAWNVMQLQGRFQPAKGEEGAIVAQLNPFATKWQFRVRPDGADKWTLEYVDDAASADLTLEMKADGSATLKGKIGTYAISAASFVSSEAMDKGAVIVDFTPVVKIGTASKVISISTNLWFDRLDVGHEEGAGEARAEE